MHETKESVICTARTCLASHRSSVVSVPDSRIDSRPSRRDGGREGNVNGSVEIQGESRSLARKRRRGGDKQDGSSKAETMNGRGMQEVTHTEENIHLHTPVPA